MNTGEDGYKSVEYDKLVALAFAGIKELLARVVVLESRIESKEPLEERVEQLNQENDALKRELQSLRSYLCDRDPSAPICGENPR